MRWAWLFLAWISICAAADPPKLIHEMRAFTIPGDERVFARHVLYPTEDESQASLESPTLIINNAAQIREEAQKNGYLEGPSGYYYRKELEKYEAGLWPCAFVTEWESIRMLSHIAYAHRWDDSPLPWEDRFLGDRDGYLPKRIKYSPKITIGSYSAPYFQFFPELNGADGAHALRLIAMLRPEIVGERTELKFLSGDESSLIFLRELFHASSEFGLHRYSFRKPDEETWREYDVWVQRTKVPEGFGFRNPEELAATIARGIPSPNGPELAEFLRKNLFSHELQPYITNSGIYAQLSGEPRGEHSLTARLVYLQKKLGLPDPLYSFIESPSIGKAGIRTDIEATPVNYFEDHILTALDRVPSLASRPATYIPDPSPRKFFHSCADLLSAWEAAFVRSRSTTPR